MNLENSIVGSIFGGIGGFLSGLFMVLGLKNRVDGHDIDLGKKQDVALCLEIHKSISSDTRLRFDYIDMKLSKFGKDQELIFEKIDKLDRLIRNGK